MAAPMDLWAHKGYPPGLESCQSAHDIRAGTISNHSYCQERNRHSDYFITTTHPHTKVNKTQTTNMKFYSLVSFVPAGGLFGHWPQFFSLLGQLSLFFLLLLLAEKQNIHTVTIGHTHIENYTVIS